MMIDDSLYNRSSGQRTLTFNVWVEHWTSFAKQFS